MTSLVETLDAKPCGLQNEGILTLCHIEPDPEPTAEDLRPYLKKMGGTQDIDLAFAQIRWRESISLQDENAFHVPFPPDFNKYQIYLTSNIWKEIRKRVLTAAGRKCVVCSAKATQVHHRDYRPRVMSGDDLRPLIALCGICHRRIHYRGNERRISWNEEDAELAAMVAARLGQQ